jgi:glutathione S-transferase
VRLLLAQLGLRADPRARRRRPLCESNAILRYLRDGTRYVPTDPYERAQVLEWSFFEES